MSKHIEEKCGKLYFQYKNKKKTEKLYISSILSSKRGIAPTKIDAN